MPFNAASLTALVQGNSFTLWHYRTTDTRAVVGAPGYFGAGPGLKPGDLIVLQTADSFALIPVRVGPAFGPGTTLDGAIGPFNTVRTVSQGFSFAQVAAAVVRTILLAPLASAFVAGAPIPVSAAVAGPVAQVVFTLRDAEGAVVPPQRVVNVVAGSASTTFPAPPLGRGYRIRVEDSADPSVASTSTSFTVGDAVEELLQEDGFRLLIEPRSRGGALLA